jgi:hypothetical protein
LHILVSVEQSLPGGQGHDDWQLLMRVLDIIRAAIPGGSNPDPGEVFGVIETALRSHYAKPIA